MQGVHIHSKLILESINDEVITPRACARGKVIGRVVVVVVVVVVHEKLSDLGIYGPQRLESTTNVS